MNWWKKITFTLYIIHNEIIVISIWIMSIKITCFCLIKTRIAMQWTLFMSIGEKNYYIFIDFGRIYVCIYLDYLVLLTEVWWDQIHKISDDLYGYKYCISNKIIIDETFEFMFAIKLIDNQII